MQDIFQTLMVYVIAKLSVYQIFSWNCSFLLLQLDFCKRQNYSSSVGVVDFVVKVLAEDNEYLDSAKAANMSMKIWKVEGGQTTSKPPLRVTMFNFRTLV